MEGWSLVRAAMLALRSSRGKEDAKSHCNGDVLASARMSGLGRTALILGFDCVLRRIALEQAGLGDVVGRIYRDHRVVGFNTYGEQHGGLHVNQTFVGLAFLESERADAAPH